MLIDDSSIDNMIHKRILTKSGLVGEVIEFLYAEGALEHLQKSGTGVDVIFVDINMPRMDGFGFLEAYEKLEPQQRGSSVVIMLSTSNDPRDAQRAGDFASLTDYQCKPLTQDVIQTIAQRHFQSSRSSQGNKNT